MTGISVFAVTAYTAHREWASRPPDERYASVQALYEAARARRQRIEERTIDSGDFRTEADDDDLVLRETSGRTAALTHWSFGQLATIASAPPNYLGVGPLNASRHQLRLERVRREQNQFSRGHRTVDRHGSITASAAFISRAGRPGARLMAGPEWHLPLGTRTANSARARTVRRLLGRPRHVSVPRGRQSRSRRSHGPHPCRSVPRIHSPEQ